MRNYKKLVSIPCDNVININVMAEFLQQIGKLQFERPSPIDEFVDNDLNLPPSRPMEFAEKNDFVVHPPTYVVPIEKVSMRMKKYVK